MAPDNNSTLGEHLRQERERRGITIEQVASATKISVRLLHLLESDNYVELPAKPFIRGFVNSYCRFIGLDPQETLTRFGGFVEQHAHERPTREAGHSGYAFERRDGDHQSRMILWIVIATFAVFGGGVYLFLKPSLRHHHGSHLERLRAARGGVPDSGVNGAMTAQSVQVPVPAASALAEVIGKNVGSQAQSESAALPWSLGEPSPAPSVQAVAAVVPPPPAVVAKPSPVAVVAEQTKPTERTQPAKQTQSKIQPGPKPSPVASARPAEAAADKPDKLNSGINLKPSEIKYKLIFRALDHVWVRYQVDDRSMMKFILRKGSILVLRAKGLVRFETSDPSSVHFSVNGSAAKLLTDDVSAAKRLSDHALILPAEEADSIEDPFPGERSILGATVPSPASKP